MGTDCVHRMRPPMTICLHPSPRTEQTSTRHATLRCDGCEDMFPPRCDCREHMKAATRTTVSDPRPPPPTGVLPARPPAATLPAAGAAAAACGGAARRRRLHACHTSRHRHADTHMHTDKETSTPDASKRTADACAPRDACKMTSEHRDGCMRIRGTLRDHLALLQIGNRCHHGLALQEIG